MEKYSQPSPEYSRQLPPEEKINEISRSLNIDRKYVEELDRVRTDLSLLAFGPGRDELRGVINELTKIINRKTWEINDRSINLNLMGQCPLSIASIERSRPQ